MQKDEGNRFRIDVGLMVTTAEGGVSLMAGLLLQVRIFNLKENVNLRELNPTGAPPSTTSRCSYTTGIPLPGHLAHRASHNMNAILFTLHPSASAIFAIIGMIRMRDSIPLTLYGFGVQTSTSWSR